MSIIFGMQVPEGEIVDESQLMHLADRTCRYAPDGNFVKANRGSVGMGFQPYRTHRRSSFDVQPAVDGFGNMLVFDGRLDNHAELCKDLGIFDPDIADPSIAIAAFDCWGEACFSRFIGDWALALWSQADQSLCLARDHAGTRTLYFDHQGDRVRWSTFLETLVGEGHTPDLDEEYVARYLAGRPLGDRTPYMNIRSIPAAHFIIFRRGRVDCKAHWNPMTEDKLRFQTDAEYERCFFALFRQSVERRTGPGAPILAQLSGGMDSSSIVCMSDYIRRGKDASSADLVDTISYYDETEPNWDERPYFTAVEARRGRAGIHVDVAAHHRTWTPYGGLDSCYLIPGMDEAALRREIELQTSIGNAGYRVILSGLGGDELLGGVPTPLPELADLLVSRAWPAFWQQSVAWSLVDHAPIGSALFGTSRLLFDCYFSDRVDQSPPPPWLRKVPQLSVDRHPLRKLSRRRSFMPSAICGSDAWRSVLSSLPNSLPDSLVRYEYRFPYLDRDLATFLLRVPREQLVRPGQRRSLMRRALCSIVPPEILQRRRKAYLARNAAIGLELVAETISAKELRSLSTVRSGFVDPDSLGEALSRVSKGQNPQWVTPLWRTLLFDLWFRSFETGFARPAPCTQDPQRARVERTPLRKFNRKQKEVHKCAT
jgi:asparagine synthase (glutamine-hydrolysing)